MLWIGHHSVHLWSSHLQRNDYMSIVASSGREATATSHRAGLILVNAMHDTALVYINDNERGLLADYGNWMGELAPHEPVSRYRHNRTGEDHGDVHLKRQIMGREVVVAITDGRLGFGRWEQIFYGEFDGRRSECALGKIIGD